jgi:pyruvate,water dikinase
MLPTRSCRRVAHAIVLCVALLAPASCAGQDDDAATSTPAETTRDWQCQLDGNDDPDYAQELGCKEDFLKLASEPMTADIPGARSIKTVIDLRDNNALYFQNSTRYKIHHDFVSAHLSKPGLAPIGNVGDFNKNYYEEYRDFLLGAATYYEGGRKYCYEIAPYDTSSPERIATAYDLVAEHTYFGNRLYFHPTSDLVEARAAQLPDSIPIITNEELYGDYQPLNLAESYGKLRFIPAAMLETEYLSFNDIVVLDRVPNDISVVVGIITEQYQTPLSHINVLSSNRGTPNMALRGAFTDEELRALEGKWVRLRVDALDYEIEEVDAATAQAWWEEHRAPEVQVPGIDLNVTDLRDIEDTIDLDSTDGNLYCAIKAGTRAFGGKAAHYGALRLIGGLTMEDAFAIPVCYYMQYMQDNGFDVEVQQMLDELADPNSRFFNEADYRDHRLASLRDRMTLPDPYTTFPARLEKLLGEKLESRDEWTHVPMRFRSSTNAEDIDGFTGAGLYTSATADPMYDPEGIFVMDSVKAAIREVWSSVWYFRAFEERRYRGIDHQAVAMAVLVHPSFRAEEANGVAITNNIFNRLANDPAFYINVQLGDLSVVQPEGGCSSDQFLYYYYHPSQVAAYQSHSCLLADDSTVLTRRQTYDLGVALDSINTFFQPAYAPRGGGWWAMDVEFKFDDQDMPSGEAPILWIKQARPYCLSGEECKVGASCDEYED